VARIAVSQQAPGFLDRAATLARAIDAVHEAALAGAALVVFPEAFIPGYPAWIWQLRPGTDMRITERLHARLRAPAVSLAGDDLRPLCLAAREHAVTVVCGIEEIDAEFSRGTLYNTVVVIGLDGLLQNRHRKLMPTNPERMVWGQGDARGLKVVDTPCGRVGTMICWESYMPLARTALYAQGVQLYLAPTYDSGDRWLASMQHIAREGGCWVVGCGCALRGRDLADGLLDEAGLHPEAEEWINPGDSVIVAPGGKIIAGPLHEELGVPVAEIDLERVGLAQRSLDVCGHYARPDIFRLQVNTHRFAPVEFAAHE
jgi:nitrilase